jgi:rRNA maturation endonuclease Nob1
MKVQKMIKETPENRENLKEHYKFVRKCILCKKPYGSDKRKEHQHKICPRCAYELTKEEE